MIYSITEIADVLDISPKQLANKNAVVGTLLTDSRSLVGEPAQALFFAIATKNNDGHNFVAQLYDHGVRNFVVERKPESARAMRDANFLVVPNVVDALQAIATAHRRRFDIPVIGITGSRGKTTVKEWLNQLLSPDFKIMRSPRSYNSQIGVPLSLWDIADGTQLAIIEAGISTTGEMARLQAMIRPTIGIITNIGAEHNEGFASMPEKAQEKAKILWSCECVVYPADDTLVTDTIKPLLDVDVAQEMAWSRDAAKGSAIVLTQVETGADASTLTYCEQGASHTLQVPFTKQADIENVMTCLAVMRYLGTSHEVIAQRMQRLTPVGTRLNVIAGINNCTIIADDYTSDYNSLTPALDFMQRRTSPMLARTVILSDLLPDNVSDDVLYRRVAELLRAKRVNRIIGIGPDLVAHSHNFDGLQGQFFASTGQFLDHMAKGDFEDESILLKGAAEFEFEQILAQLEAKQHQTVEEVDLNALAHNFKFFKGQLQPATKTVALVKANGYGTGSYEVAKTLQDCGASYLAVAAQDEGADLRTAGITMPIIVLNPSVINYKALFVNNLEPEVYSIDECRQLIKEGKKYGAYQFPVHIKIDSGMHRLGFTREQLPALVDLLQGQDTLKPVSIFSHLSVADEPAQDEYTMMQVSYFKSCADIVSASFPHHILRHILNTTGIVRFPQYQFDMVRIGIGLYGVKTVFDGREDALKTVASLHSVVISIKEWPAGTTIGYGRHGVLERPSRIATVTIGYYDGFDRHFGNGAVSVWINGSYCPTVGNVCMDAIMVDVTDAQCKVGDRVEIFGHHVPIERLSDVRGTIPYEILTSVSPRVKRVYYND